MQNVNGLSAARDVLREACGVKRDAEEVASRQSPVASKVELVSPPYAACHAGVGYYVALIEQLKTEFPDVPFTFTVCCGDDAAIAHDALRLGLDSIIFRGSAEMYEKLKAIADGLGARVLGVYPAL